MNDTRQTRESITTQKLSLYQNVLGFDDAALIASGIDAGSLAELQRGDISGATADVLSQIGSAMGIATGDLLPDPLDAPNLAPQFAGMERKELQVHHERAVAASLAKVMRAKGLAVHALRRGDERASEPDAVMTMSVVRARQDVGIEVTCVGYYERGSTDAGAYARDLWDAAARDRRSRGSADGDAQEDDGIELGPVLTNFDDVRTYAQGLLDQKCRKTYSMPTILVIDAGMHHIPLTPAEEGRAIVRGLNVPDDCPFARIYLRMTWNFTGEVEYFIL